MIDRNQRVVFSSHLPPQKRHQNKLHRSTQACTNMQHRETDECENINVILYWGSHSHAISKNDHYWLDGFFSLSSFVSLLSFHLVWAKTICSINMLSVKTQTINFWWLASYSLFISQCDWTILTLLTVYYYPLTVWGYQLFHTGLWKNIHPLPDLFYFFHICHTYSFQNEP